MVAMTNATKAKPNTLFWVYVTGDEEPETVYAETPEVAVKHAFTAASWYASEVQVFAPITGERWRFKAETVPKHTIFTLVCEAPKESIPHPAKLEAIPNGSDRKAIFPDALNGYDDVHGGRELPSPEDLAPCQGFLSASR